MLSGFSRSEFVVMALQAGKLLEMNCRPRRRLDVLLMSLKSVERNILAGVCLS